MTITETIHRTMYPGIQPEGYDTLEDWARDSDYEYRLSDYWGYGWFQVDHEDAPPVDLDQVYADAMEAAALADRTERHLLVGFGTFPELAQSIRAALFGHMARRAEGVIEQYHLDLWHDAMKVAAIEGPCTFWWAPRQSGTHIGETPWSQASATLEHALADDTAVVYHVTLSCESGGQATDDGGWYATFTREAR